MDTKEVKMQALFRRCSLKVKIPTIFTQTDRLSAVARFSSQSYYTP